MADYTKETVTTDDGNHMVQNTPSKREEPGHRTLEYLVYYVLGALELLLGFRLVLKLLGANPVSDFVSAIYSLSAIFIVPFEGIFRRGFTEGVETTAILEPATIVAMIVYAVLAWGIVRLIQILSRDRD